MALFVSDENFEMCYHLGCNHNLASSEGKVNSNSPGFQIQVDGNEKDMLEAQIKNIPISKGRIAVYRGDFARFILDNLRL